MMTKAISFPVTTNMTNTISSVTHSNNLVVSIGLRYYTLVLKLFLMVGKGLINSYHHYEGI